MTLGFAFIALMVIGMAYTAFTSAEVAADKPWGSDQATKVKDNFDYLVGVSSQIVNLHSSGTVAASGDIFATFTLDSTINWLDRNIVVYGVAAGSWNNLSGSLADVQKVLPGTAAATEAEDMYYNRPPTTGPYYGTATFAGTPTEYDFFNGWMYSGEGSATYSAGPFLRGGGVLGTAAGCIDLYIWVDNTDSNKLKLTTVYSAGSAYDRYAAWNLIVTYSEDLGGV